MSEQWTPEALAGAERVLNILLRAVNSIDGPLDAGCTHCVEGYVEVANMMLVEAGIPLRYEMRLDADYDPAAVVVRLEVSP